MNNETWNSLIRELPGANFLQTGEWAEVKAQVGWRRDELILKDENGGVTSAAQILIRSARLFRFGPALRVGYVPRGPLTRWEDEAETKKVLSALEARARAEKLVFIKIDPEVTCSDNSAENDAEEEGIQSDKTVSELKQRGWRYSPEQIQFKNTMLLNLEGDETAWLARMKQKTRYNLRLAQKNGVVVRTASLTDIPLLYRMFAETGNRDGFIIRPEAYYRDVWSRFMQAGMAQGLIAEVDGTPAAGLVFFYYGRRAWFVYGMSTAQHREKMPNYLLQWEAMRAAREVGCSEYDLWGAPDIFEQSDPMYGVYRFKEGFGAEVVRYIGAWDYPVRPWLYRVYHQVIPRLLSITRFFRRRQIQQEVV